MNTTILYVIIIIIILAQPLMGLGLLKDFLPYVQRLPSPSSHTDTDHLPHRPDTSFWTFLGVSAPSRAIDIFAGSLGSILTISTCPTHLKRLSFIIFTICGLYRVRNNALCKERKVGRKAHRDDTQTLTSMRQFILNQNFTL